MILSTEGEGDADVADEDEDDECSFYFCYLFLHIIDFEVGDGECFDYFLFCELLDFVLI